MKGKLALVAFLATAVTIGGVYATWTFAEGATTSAGTNVTVAMSGYNSETEKGTLAVLVNTTNGYTMAIDDADNNHMPEILSTGVVTVKFTPALTASQDVKANGIDTDFVITYKGLGDGSPATIADWMYEGVQIFNIINDETTPIHLAKEDATWDGTSFVWTIDHTEIGIELTSAFQNVVIDTLDKYDALNAVLGKGIFVFTVQEHV